MSGFMGISALERRFDPDLAASVFWAYSQRHADYDFVMTLAGSPCMQQRGPPGATPEGLIINLHDPMQLYPINGHRQRRHV